MSFPSQDFSPVKWSDYFDNRKELYINGSKFNVYLKGTGGLAIIALHGAGYSGLSWALFAKEITSKINCQIIAIDLRGHGLSSTKNDADLELGTLANDVIDIISTIFEQTSPSILFIGHSLGGAVAVEATRLQVRNTVGLCVIDVVEGSALESLSSMQSVLRNRPNNFESVEHAIQWSFCSGQTCNLEAAKISMPSQIENVKTKSLGSLDVELTPPTLVGENSFKKPNKCIPKLPNTIAEVDEDENNYDCKKEKSNQNLKDIYTWRIDLTKTEHFWDGWFKGLSQKFLNVTVPKILLLANIHGLDTALTIGQMQGKFQMKVLQKSGHAIHEDQPKNVADVLSMFLIKQQIAIAKDI